MMRREAAGTALFLWLALAGALGCTSARPTQVIVLVSAEPMVRGETETMRLVVEAYPDEGAEGLALDQEQKAPFDWPLKLVLEPKRGDASRRYRVTAQAQGDGDRVIATARLLGGFVAGQKRYVQLILEDACRVSSSCTDAACDLACKEDETCHDGACVPATVLDPTTFGLTAERAPSAGELTAESMPPDGGLPPPKSGSGAVSGSGATSGSGSGGTSGSRATSGSGGGSGSGAGGREGMDAQIPMDSGPATDAGTDTGTPPPALTDPGSGPWEEVAPADLARVCRLDPSLLAQADAMIGSPYAVFRYGKLCHSFGSDTPDDVYQMAQLVLGTALGAAAYETRSIPRTGPMTGPLLDTDFATHWLASVSYNANARLAHVMAMVAHNSDLTYGAKSFSFDTVGATQVNSLFGVLATAITQDAGRLGATPAAFGAQLFAKLGMTDSSWPTATTNWTTTLRDMGRLGTLLLHGGVFGGERLIDAKWVYRMTHPAFEDASPAFGYLTWLNHRGHDASGMHALDPCAPAALWPSYPHALSNAPHCEPGAGQDCDQTYDVGVWSGKGLGGQLLLGHPGLDLVIAAKDYTVGDGAVGLWARIRPALVALDPRFTGDEAAFCAAYAANEYAPDLRVEPTP